MKTRMASARCCCAGGGGLVCDPVTGYTDEFTALAEGGGTGRWNWSTILGVTPFISTSAINGELIIEDGNVFSSGPLVSFFQRCAVWNQTVHGGNWPNATGYQYRATYRFEAWPDIFATCDGVGFYFVTQQLGEPGVPAHGVTHGLQYVAGTGWRHKITVKSPGRQDYSVYAGAVIQAAQFPAPTGPHEGELIYTLAPLPSQNWYASVSFRGVGVIGFPNGLATKPSNTDQAGSVRPEFVHGFNAGQDVKALNMLRWSYTA